jgi:hypothetical protein
LAGGLRTRAACLALAAAQVLPERRRGGGIPGQHPRQGRGRRNDNSRGVRRAVRRVVEPDSHRPPDPTRSGSSIPEMPHDGGGACVAGGTSSDRLLPGERIRRSWEAGGCAAMGWVLATSGSPIVRQRDGRRRGRAGLKPGLYGAGRRRRGLFGEGRLGFARGKPFEALGKREAVVVVRVDGIADGFAPGVGAEGLAECVHPQHASGTSIGPRKSEQYFACCCFACAVPAKKSIDRSTRDG